MKFHVIGVAPSRHSSGPDDAPLAWCPQSPSGQKVRHLADGRDPAYENASGVWPGAHRRGDRLPWRRCGYDLLCRRANDATSDREALILGLEYWRPVFEWLRREGQMHFEGRVPIGTPLEVKGSDGVSSLTVQLLPHPRNWPEVKPRHVGSDYRRELIDALERQQILSGGAKPRPLLAGHYDRALARYGL